MKVQDFMKMGFAIAVLACGMTFTSCGGNGELSASDVKKEVERVMYGSMNYFETATLRIGYYEQNDAETRMNLRKLAAVGLITYKAENIIENKKSYWGSSRKIEHIFVNVELTEEGEKFVATDEELEKIKEDIAEKALDEDLVNPNEATEYPEDSISVDEVIPVKDDAPASEQNSAVVESVVEEPLVSEIKSTEVAPVKETAHVVTASSYEKALALASAAETYVNVKLYKVDISKVRKIQCTPKMMEEGDAEAQVIMEYVDVTPFGRILGNKRDGEKIATNVKFIKYVDGWELKNQ